MGTPEFAVPSLKILIEKAYNVVGVVTAPDRESGRGRKIRMSPIKEFSLKHKIPLLQPEKLKDDKFLSQLNKLEANLQIVVAFRMLPEVVWSTPHLGTINLHASLLPQYRGAAPINHAIINGEKTTGLTTFFIDKEIDTGNIILQEELAINEEEDYGNLHDRMMSNGATLLLKTIDKILKNEFVPIPQNDLSHQEDTVKLAPKLTKLDCQINWNKPINDIYNFIRGMSPYPGAFTILHSKFKEPLSIKIFKSRMEYLPHDLKCGQIISDSKSLLKVAAVEGYIHVLELQIAGKRKMNSIDLLRGFSFSKGDEFE